MNGETYKSTFLISNLHCPSCVATIDSVFHGLIPAPQKWSSSVVSQQIDIEHGRDLHVQQIIEALVEAGFEIDSISSNSPDAPKQRPNPVEPESLTKSSPLRRWLSYPTYQRLSSEEQSHRHDEYCDVCGAHDSGDSEIPLVVDTPKPQVKRARLAVSGMSCSSCVNTISSTLKDIPWIQSVNVNLVSNSAVVDFVPPGTIEEVIQNIEDLGYDVSVDSVFDLAGPVKQEAKSSLRTIQLKIDGFHCAKCPLHVMEGLESFGNKVQVKSQPTIDHPILEISYTPEAPLFTIRHIINALSSVDPKFQIGVYHPPTLEEQSQLLFREHLKSITRRFVLTAIISIPTFIIGIVFMTLVPETNHIRRYFMEPFSRWTGNANRFEVSLFILATPVYFFAADLFHRRALREIWTMWRPGSKTPYLHRFFRFGSMDMLTSLGTTIAYVSSLIVMIIEATKPSTTDPMGAGDSYFDAVVFLSLFLLMGRLLELYSKSKAGDAVAELGKLRPTQAYLVETSASNGNANGHSTTKTVSVDLVDVGDMLRVPSGTSPPCDGIITEGETKFDEASLTGESRLIHKKPGDEVFSGTVNDGGPVLVRATGVAGSSMLDQIVSAVRDGQTNRAPIERFADVITSYFVPIITLLAIVTWIIWLTLGLSGSLPPDYLDISTDGWAFWSLQFAIAVFVVACPCGVGLAAPTALFVGGGLAAKYGILVKGGGEAFQEASNLDSIVFDKTGTLTTGGEPAITDSELFPNDKSGVNEQFLLSAMRSLEESSNHPIAKAVVSFCEKKSAPNLRLLRMDEISGKGMSGVVSNPSSGLECELLFGNEALLKDFHVPILSNVDSVLERWKNQAKSIAILAMRERSSPESGPWKVRAILAASDPIRPEARGVIQSLQKRNIQVFMLSGDNPTTANAVGKSLGIPSSNIIAGALPSQKADKIRALQQSLEKMKPSSFFSRFFHKSPELDLEKQTRRSIVAMVGDGINDSPALTAADVGIAIGSGSDIAISAAKFVLVSPKLTTVLTLIDLSRVVFRRVKMNFAWALIYNILAVPVAGGAFYFLKTEHGSHIRLDPVWASLAMALSSFSVVLSSLALRLNVPYIGFRKVEK